MSTVEEVRKKKRVEEKRARKTKTKKSKQKAHLEDRDLDLGVLDAAIVVDVDGREDAARNEGEEGIEDALCGGRWRGVLGGPRLKMMRTKKRKKRRAGKVEQAEKMTLEF